MRFLRKLLLWIIGLVLLLIVLAYATGNGHLVRGVRFTYLMGRGGPEIDDRNFFPYTTIPADAPQPWPQDKRYGHLSITSEQEKQLLALNTVGFVVVQNDSLIYENYFGGWNADSVSNSFSVAKSYVSVLTGIAIQEGRVKSVDDPVGSYLPEFDELDGCHANITLKHLLTMSTGLDWSESGADSFSDNAKGYYGTEVRKLAMDQPCRDEPGKEFDYISGSTQIMADVLQKVYGKGLDELTREKTGSRSAPSIPRSGARTAPMATSRPSAACTPRRVISPASASCTSTAACGKARASCRWTIGRPR
ncbi:MAG: serine hydrolase [Flavobacteriales bacterium]